MGVDQQQMEYLPHCAIVRSRLNVKFEVRNLMGRSRTRYRKYLFSVKAQEKQVKFMFTDTVLVLGFGGKPYTVVGPQVYGINGDLTPLEWELHFRCIPRFTKSCL